MIMTQRESLKKTSKNPNEKPPVQKEIDKTSEHGSDNQTVDKDADYDNKGRPNSPFN